MEHHRVVLTKRVYNIFIALIFFPFFPLFYVSRHLDNFLVAKQLYEPLMSVCLSVCLSVFLYVFLSPFFVFC